MKKLHTEITKCPSPDCNKQGDLQLMNDSYMKCDTCERIVLIEDLIIFEGYHFLSVYMEDLED